MEKDKPKNISVVITTALVISFLVGGMSGGFFGYLASEGSLSTWFKTNVLGQDTIQDSFLNINTSTLQIEENSENQ